MKLRLKPLAYIAILSTLAGCTTVIPEILRKIELPPEELIPEIFRTYNLSPEELKVQKNRCEFHRDNRACNIVGLHYGYYYIILSNKNLNYPLSLKYFNLSCKYGNTVGCINADYVLGKMEENWGCSDEDIAYWNELRYGTREKIGQPYHCKFYSKAKVNTNFFYNQPIYSVDNKYRVSFNSKNLDTNFQYIDINSLLYSYINKNGGNKEISEESSHNEENGYVKPVPEWRYISEYSVAPVFVAQENFQALDDSDFKIEKTPFVNDPLFGAEFRRLKPYPVFKTTQKVIDDNRMKCEEGNDKACEIVWRIYSTDVSQRTPRFIERTRIDKDRCEKGNPRGCWGLSKALELKEYGMSNKALSDNYKNKYVKQAKQILEKEPTSELIDYALSGDEKKIKQDLQYYCKAKGNLTACTRQSYGYSIEEWINFREQAQKACNNNDVKNCYLGATIAKYLKDFHGELDFYNKSCQLGKASACFDAAISKENNQDYISIYNAMHDACSKGSGRACELIAELINNPNDQMSLYLGLRKDVDKHLSYLERSCQIYANSDPMEKWISPSGKQNPCYRLVQYNLLGIDSEHKANEDKALSLVNEYIHRGALNIFNLINLEKNLPNGFVDDYLEHGCLLSGSVTACIQLENRYKKSEDPKTQKKAEKVHEYICSVSDSSSCKSK